MRGPGQPHRPNLFQTPEICHRRATSTTVELTFSFTRFRLSPWPSRLLELEPEFQLNTSTPWKTGMAAHRAQRKGHLQIGEISCVVGLYTAGSTSERISFHMLNEKTGNPRRRQLSKINRLGQSARPQGRRSASSSNFAGRGRDRSQAISAC